MNTIKIEVTSEELKIIVASCMSTLECDMPVGELTETVEPARMLKAWRGVRESYVARKVEGERSSRAKYSNPENVFDEEVATEQAKNDLYFDDIEAGLLEKLYPLLPQEQEVAHA